MFSGNGLLILKRAREIACVIFYTPFVESRASIQVTCYCVDSIFPKILIFMRRTSLIIQSSKPPYTQGLYFCKHTIDCFAQKKCQCPLIGILNYMQYIAVSTKNLFESLDNFLIEPLLFNNVFLKNQFCKWFSGTSKLECVSASLSKQGFFEYMHVYISVIDNKQFN